MLAAALCTLSAVSAATNAAATRPPIRLPAPITLNGVGGITLDTKPLAAQAYLNQPLIGITEGSSAELVVPICRRRSRGEIHYFGAGYAAFTEPERSSYFGGVWFRAGAHTDRGIGIGATRRSVAEKYRDLNIVKLNSDYWLVASKLSDPDSRDPSIMFAFGVTGRVREIGYGDKQALERDGDGFSECPAAPPPKARHTRAALILGARGANRLPLGLRADAATRLAGIPTLRDYDHRQLTLVPICMGATHGIAMFAPRGQRSRLTGAWFNAGVKTTTHIGIGSTLASVTRVYGHVRGTLLAPIPELNYIAPNADWTMLAVSRSRNHTASSLALFFLFNRHHNVAAIGYARKRDITGEFVTRLELPIFGADIRCPQKT